MADGSWMIGKWESTSVENFDEFMKTLGVNFIVRKASAFATTYYDVTKEGEMFVWKWVIAMKSGVARFRFNEEFDEVTPDGRPVKSTSWMEGEVFQEIQKGKPHDVKLTRSLDSDGFMHEICEANGVVTKRKYKKTA